MANRTTAAGDTKVSSAAKEILKAVASGKTHPEELGLRGGAARALGALKRGRLLSIKVEKVQKLELTPQGRAVLQGTEAGKSRAVRGGRSGSRAAETTATQRRVKAHADGQRGRRPDQNSKRAKAEGIIAKFQKALARKDLIQKLCKEVHLTPASASTYIYNAGKRA